jgi:hypothetical protein
VRFSAREEILGLEYFGSKKDASSVIVNMSDEARVAMARWRLLLDVCGRIEIECNRRSKTASLMQIIS